MAVRPTANTAQLIRDAIRLVDDIHNAANGRLSTECCDSLAAGILARDTHGETIYESIPGDARRPAASAR